MADDDADNGGPDLLELLEADHRRIERLLGEGADTHTLIHEIETHVVAEDQVLYPEARKKLNADDLVDACLDVDHLQEEALVALEHGTVDVGVVKELFDRHVARQESDLFPALHEVLPRERLVALGDALQLSVRTAPTHGHPHLPDSGTMEVIADLVAARLDQLRDAFREGREGR
jgi:hemerythrin-like domain-containing protein